MTVAIPAAFVLSTLFLATWAIFTTLFSVTTDQTTLLRETSQLHSDQLRTTTSITSTNRCKNYTATVRNGSKDASFGDFADIDVFARYLDATGDTVATRLANPTEWTASSISPNITNPNMWDPGEAATILFDLSPVPSVGTEGTVAIAVPGGISDSAYFYARNQ